MKLLIILLLTAFCVSTIRAEETWTLYRNEPGAPWARIHVATFDAYLERPKAPPASYNRQNCWLAAEMFRFRSGSLIRYWCEYGRHLPN